jgi:alpha-tubulin suppressor-like RCC1 family protein
VYVVGPTKVPGIDSAAHLGTIKDHTCVTRLTPPTLLCWGSNSNLEGPEPHVNHKLGPAAGDRPYSASPVPVEFGESVVTPGTGFESNYVHTAGGRVYAWGTNDRRQLGTGHRETIVATPSPVLVETAAGLTPLTGVEAVIRSDGSTHCAHMLDRSDFGTPFICWGADDWGEVGVGTVEGTRSLHPFPVPVRAVPLAANVLVLGADHACAGGRTGNGSTEIWCYGRPGALGNGTKPAEDDAPATQWLGTAVVWKPANFVSALE